MLDVLIRNATVVDGTGSPPRRGDLAIRDGRVAVVGATGEPARRVVEADGLVAAPGFVDIHVHYDAQLMWDPTASPSPLHGVTTVVGGNCGFTIAPLAEAHADYLMRMMARVEGMPLEALRAGLTWDWGSFADWLDRLDGRLAVNAGFLVGHSAIRRVVMGEAAVGATADGDQVAEMARVAHQAMAAGALGLSSSLAPTHNDGDGNPVPSRHATHEELLALAETVRDHAGTTVEFIPAVGPFSEEVVELMAAMSLAANRPLNWNLLGVNAASPALHEGQLAASDRAAERGACVVALTLPDLMRLRLNLSTGFVLDALPGWADLFRLPIEERTRALADTPLRSRLREGAASPEAGPIGAMCNWAQMEITETFSPDNDGLAGRRIGDLAAERGKEPFDALVDIALADGLRTSFAPPALGADEKSWQVRARVWRDPRTVLGGSDAGAHLDMQCNATYTTALLGQSVRERALLPLEEAVRQLTDVPARLYGLRGRGRIAEGWQADLVLFDPQRIGPGPVHTRVDLPGGAARLYAEAEGIDRVFVNGTEIVAEGTFTGALPGTLLRSGRDTETVEVPGTADAMR